MQARRFLLVSLAIFAALGLACPAQSQDWPQKPVRIIVPFAAGGNNDIVARILAQRLGEVFGQQFVVEDRPGASGTIAAQATARAPSDGYTLLFANVSVIAIAPAVTRTAYDPVKDFTPICNIGTYPVVLVVHPSTPVTTAAGFIDYVRKQPVKLAYATSGPGSLSHLGMAMFLKRAGLDMTPVMYRGGAPALADVIAGHVATYFANLPVAVPLGENGALRLLAVSTEKRAPQIPDVPTFIEAGFPGFKILAWNGLMAPAGTPRAIVDVIAKEVSRAVQDPKFAELLVKNGVDPVGSSPEEFAATVAADVALWAEAVRIAGAVN
jgi:tripartite-type tricarboxylate transporter receptor subunit TctC